MKIASTLGNGHTHSHTTEFLIPNQRAISVLTTSVRFPRIILMQLFFLLEVEFVRK